jgi:hypothetical protein
MSRNVCWAVAGACVHEETNYDEVCFVKRKRRREREGEVKERIYWLATALSTLYTLYSSMMYMMYTL